MTRLVYFAMIVFIPFCYHDMSVPALTYQHQTPQLNFISKSTMAPSASAATTTNNSNDVVFFPSSKIKLLHQRTSLSLAYDRLGWGYEGETVLYIVAESSVESDEKSNTEGDNISGILDSSLRTTDNKGGENNAIAVPSVADNAPALVGSLNSTKNASSSISSLLDGNDKSTIELALHLRDGLCHVDSVDVFCAAAATTSKTITAKKGADNVDIMDVDKDGEKWVSTDTTTAAALSSNAQLCPIPHRSVTFAHYDPLSVFLTAPHIVKEQCDSDSDAATDNDTVRDNKTTKVKRVRRYEADAHATRGTKGMTNSLRAASISSSVGELRIIITPNHNHEIDNSIIYKPPISTEEAYQCWKNDITSTSAAGEVQQGMMESKVNTHMIKHRCCKRREVRLGQVAQTLAESTATTTTTATSKSKWPLSASMKIVIRFSMSPSSISALVDHGRLHLGGINFIAPRKNNGGGDNSTHPSLSTPHVYTNCGTYGDHLGIRSWLPTLDSASPKHRASHEFVTKVTSTMNEGLWPTGSGEDFGYNLSVSHPILLPLDGGEMSSENDATIAADGDDDGTILRQLMNKHQDDILVKENKENILKKTLTLYQLGVMEAEVAWKALDSGISNTLGRRHARFINKFFYPSDDKNDDDHHQSSYKNNGGDNPPSFSTMPALDDALSSPPPSSTLLSGLKSEMMNQILHHHTTLRPTYVTSIYSSLTWLPCPSRSLGFAVGPFATLYDPEYFRLSPEDDDDDDDDDDVDYDDNDGEVQLESERRRRSLSMEDGNVGGPSKSPRQNHSRSLHEMAHELGEGIRQLYFAPRYERRYIHEDVNDIFFFAKLLDTTIGYCPLTSSRRPELSTTRLLDKQQLERSILASTMGVTNRALSLMRDVLALPAYRTSSYTQVWIPYAQWSGDSSGGNMVGCPEVGGCNPFLGGAILNSTLLPPPGMRLPYYEGGKYLQFLQARNAIRGWVRAALPLGSNDDVGQVYIHVLVESFLMSLYERGHGAYGEGGAKGTFFYTKRYAISSGLNSPNIDFLPLVNIEDDEIGGGGAIAVEDRGNEALWRSTNNGTETHTSAIDDFYIGQLQMKDFVEALERMNDKSLPLPLNGWQGSHQSATFLSHNSASSSSLGCGALELVHPMGGQMYRATKACLLSRVYEGRAGISDFTRAVRAAFIASFLRDAGVAQLVLPDDGNKNNQENDLALARPPFVACVDEMMKKQGITHAIFTRALRVMAGPLHEAYLRGNLVDIGRDRSHSGHLMPEGFPNSYVRGASGLYLRVGVHIEAADGSTAQSVSVAPQSAAAVKGTHLHVVAEPVIVEGGIAFGGPVTLRVIENEGQCREFIKNIPTDGSRIEWGPIFLHARPVSTVKQQQAASGISEAPTTIATDNTAPEVGADHAGSIINSGAGMSFTSDQLHKGGFQALELIRITNLTPLLWVRVDSQGLYNGRINCFQQDACLAEQLFHDGDAAGQVEALRALAERPFKIQGMPKITNVHDVPIAELPVRVLGDCLRGSVALHCDLPHNPAVRAQAAFAIAQWQNNKAPASRDVVGDSAWLGLDLLLQYFRERFYCNGVVMPNNFRRVLLHKNISAGGGGGDFTSDGGYQYLDALIEKDERRNAIEFADEVEIEEDEEYRVRSACVTAIASIRAQDGMTPAAVTTFLEEVLLCGDKAAVGSLLLPEEEEQLKKKQDQALNGEVHYSRRIIGPNDDDVSNLPYVSVSLVRDALLALCYVHVRSQCDGLSSKSDHPILPLMELCLGWLDWDLERIRLRTRLRNADNCGVGDASFTCVAPCAITAVCHMALLKQSTTSSPVLDNGVVDDILAKRKLEESGVNKATTAQFYIDIFDDDFIRGDAIRAAAAQSVICICCAADRNEEIQKEPLGLLRSLEFILDRILGKSFCSV